MKFVNYLPDKLEYSYDESSKSLKLKFYDNDSGYYECEYYSVMKNGEWICTDDDIFNCSECDFEIDATGCIDPMEYLKKYNFCPNCGAEMRSRKTMNNKIDSESCVKTIGDVLEMFEPYLDENDILEVIEELEKVNKGEQSEID